MKLSIHVKGSKALNEKTNELITVPDMDLTLEHSLYTISKWESKWHKSFLETKEKTDLELKSYIHCMIVTDNVPEYIVNFLSIENQEKIRKFIEDPMTATKIYTKEEKQHSVHTEKITSELIYYWMISYEIPVEFEHWHLSRLLTLIRICGIKNNPPQKRSMRDIMNSNRSLNAQRRAKFNSRG